jgi:DNA-binding XRE family transcriptional regulator
LSMNDRYSGLPNHFEQYRETPEYLQLMKSIQNGLCAICQKKATLYIDHDHGTEQVRGWLCAKCNTGLGYLGDSTLLLERAIDYLLSVHERRQQVESMLEGRAPFPTSEKARRGRSSGVSVPSLKKLRIQAGYSINQVAQAAGVSSKTIYRIEDGENVSRELAQAVINVINERLITSYTVDDISKSRSR